MTRKVIVLGSSGMLGSMVVDDLSRDPEIKLAATVRTAALKAKCARKIPNVSWLIFDANAPDAEKALKVIDGYDWVINAIGITKPLVHDDNAFEVEMAIKINSLLPHQLARQAESSGARVIQIASDCVFSGKKGKYVESGEFDPLDVYGKTKSLGEVPSPGVYHLRCSIIGPEPKEHKFLLDWFLGQPKNARVNGFINHRWNGIATLHFSRLCHGIIASDLKLTHVQHIVPTGEVTKCELLEQFARYFHREDVTITPVKTPVVVDRTLKTTDEALNLAIWSAAGYRQPPSVPEMVAELASFDYRLNGL
ncbi:MAG: sugar nucleotide-binding protein [Dehalococcoidales bacterium]